MAEDRESAANVAMMRDIDERLRARMVALEREVASVRGRSRVLFLGLLVTLALLVVVAAFPDLIASTGVRAASESLEVRRLVLLGPEGRGRRGEWSVDEDGNARLSLMDQQGRPRLNLTVLGGGFPGISLANAEGQRRAVLGLLPDETTSLVFADHAGVTRAVVGLTQQNAANLVFADANGITRIGLGLDGNGVGSVMLPEEDSIEGDAEEPSGNQDR